MIKKILLIIFILVFGAISFNTYAQTPATEFELANPVGEQDIWGIVTRIINILFLVCIYGGIILIIWAGFTMITSQGDPKKMSNGVKIITSVLIGIVVVLLARSIISLTYYIVTGQKWGGTPSNNISTTIDPTTNLPYDPSAGVVAPSFEVQSQAIPKSVFESGFDQ